jgi:signal transduction histidine kinase
MPHEGLSAPSVTSFFQHHPFVLAVLTVTFALGIRLVLDPWLGDGMPYPMFFVALILTSFYGSTRAALGAAILGGLVADFFLVPPRFHFGFANAAYMVGFLEYLIAAAAIVWLSKSRSDASSLMQQTLLRLGESEERQRIALGAANMGTWSWDLKTDTVTWDAQCRKLFGLPDHASATDRATFFKMLHVDDREQTGEALRNAIALTTDYDETHRVVWPDQIVHWLRCKGRAVLERDKQFMIGVSLDVTAGKLTEEVMRANERLLGGARLANALAHEINNPLSIVINALYLLGQQSLSDSQRNELLIESQHAADRVARITGQMLHLYPRGPAPSRFRLCDVLDRLIDEFQESARARNVSLSKRFQYDGEVLAVAEDLRQVGYNILLNCLENVRDGGKVVVHLSSCQDWKHGQPRVRLAVADNGPGIPEELRLRIFQPFTSTKLDKASGLGLWICCGILNKYGATIRYRTSTVPGRSGTCFAVTFPEGVLQSVGLGGPQPAVRL